MDLIRPFLFPLVIKSNSSNLNYTFYSSPFWVCFHLFLLVENDIFALVPSFSLTAGRLPEGDFNNKSPEENLFPREF
jgi:hypothetical protein